MGLGKLGGWIAALMLVGRVLSPASGQTPPERPAGYVTVSDDDGVAAPSVESLQDAWQIALAADQRVEAGNWNVSAAQYARSAAKAEYFPSLSLGANYFALSDEPALRVRTPPLAGASFPFLGRDSVGYHAIVSQPLYTFGRIRSGLEAADADLRVQEAELVRTRLETKMQVAEVYVAILRAGRLVAVAESKVAALSAHAREVQARHQRGLVLRNDLLSVQLAVADTEQQVVETRNSLAMLHAAYNRALGRALSEAVHIAEIHDMEVMETLEELTESARQKRSEIQAVTLQARSLRAQAEQARTKNRPQIAVQGGYVHQSDPYLDPNGIAGIALTAQWNVFDSGRAGNQAEALSQRAESLLRLRRDVESRIALEVRQKWLQWQTAKERLVLAQKTIDQAEENFTVARNRYRQALGTNADVLDAETQRAQAYINMHTSTYDVVLAVLRLQIAAGAL